MKRHQELLYVTQCQLQTALRQACHCPKLGSSVTSQQSRWRCLEESWSLHRGQACCSPWRVLCAGAGLQAGPETHGGPGAAPEGLHPVEKDSCWSCSLRTPSCGKAPHRRKLSGMVSCGRNSKQGNSVRRKDWHTHTQNVLN